MATTSKSSAKPAADPPSSGGLLGRIIRPLIWVLVLLIVAALCITGTWFYLHWKSKSDTNPVQIEVGKSSAPSSQAQSSGGGAKPTPPVPIPAPIFLKLDPFTVMLENADSERMLYLGVTLRLADQASSDRIEKYMPEARSRILMILSGLAPQDVSTPAGKTKIMQEIKAAVSKPFAPIPDGQNVSDVLFTEFVVQ